ncbi:MAG TPA: hypothetical protein VFX96_17285 [Pyrinomonadaceae bacterium]|nr:hypothetical protein [Pyrinomonadaceae bacterium]
MRWKLLIISALLSTLVGAGACLAVVHYGLGATDRLDSPDGWVAAAFLLPLAAVTYASIFVYRRTARRRALQAVLVALVSLALILGALVAVSAWAARRRAVPLAPSPEISNAV